VEYKALALRHGEIVARFRIRFQARPVGFIRGEAIECNQPPSYVVCSFMRKKIANKMTTASRNDAAPILGVQLEPVALERIDLVADDAGDGRK
jgi:hypothetical protein